MQNEAVMLQCPNEYCKAANRETDKYCQQCGAFIPKYYLWTVGEDGESYQVGELVAERYLLKSEKIFLDTKPGLAPESFTPEIVSTAKPYLRLVPYRLHIPQIYALLPQKRTTDSQTLLLESAPIDLQSQTKLLPTLSVAWQKATSLRQLNWLWQIAQLWQPLSSEGVVSSLLDPELLRVEGSLIRLLELQSDTATRPNIADLGQIWSKWVTTAKPSIAAFLQQLCTAMMKGEIASADFLIAILDQGIAELGRSQTRKLVISTATDTGPSRQRNEDACYPATGTVTTPAAEALAIVCDGIGGHEGGNVASNLAIETLQQQVKQLPLHDIDATTLINELEHFVRVTNDCISQRNDHEHRFGRQRMGTTLVMALGHEHEIYITHVGDSRAYWIVPTGCHQVTLDDDVASREVRLGYSPYRNALEQPSSGSLVQALGMSASTSALHPTVQRFVLDESCVFLLCSDGLSDYDRIEESWDSAILPVLNGDRHPEDAVAHLIELGNRLNGHDNITVALILCEVQYAEPQSPLSANLTGRTNHKTAINPTKLPVNSDYAGDAVVVKTKLLQSQQRRASSLLPTLLGLLVLVLVGGALAYYLLPELSRTNQPSNNPQLPESPTASPQTPNTPAVAALSIGTLLQINRPIQLNEQNTAIASPPNTTQRPQIERIQVPANSVLRVTAKQDNVQQGDLIRLKLLCATNPPSNNQAPTPPPRLIQLGQEGWIDQASLQPNIRRTLGQSKSDSCPLPTNSTVPIERPSSF